MQTTYERGIQQGMLQGQRKAASLLLEDKFGPLSPEVKERVESLSEEQVRQLLLDLVKAGSLEELHLKG
jgi:hypothetical protein